MIVLDLMLPKMDGLSILKKLRANDCPALIIILTAKDTEQDKVTGLIDSRHVVLYASVALLCLFLTVRSLESRRWQ